MPSHHCHAEEIAYAQKDCKKKNISTKTLLAGSAVRRCHLLFFLFSLSSFLIIFVFVYLSLVFCLRIAKEASLPTSGLILPFHLEPNKLNLTDTVSDSFLHEIAKYGAKSEPFSIVATID